MISRFAAKNDGSARIDADFRTLQGFGVSDMFVRVSTDMVGIAQLVRASVCGTEGRGFESRYPPLTAPGGSDRGILFTPRLQ